MKSHDYKAVGRLIGLNLRQHRVFLACWVLIPALLVWATAVSTAVMFPTRESLLAILPTLQDPMVVGMHGKVLDISVAGYTAWRTKVICSLLAGIFSFIMVIRHTRRDEEEGRREILGSLAVGRQAPLAAALLTAFMLNLAMAGLILLGMLAAGLGLTGSLAHSLSIFAYGCFFAAMTGLLVQVFAGSRTSTSLSVVLLVVLMTAHIGWNVQRQRGGLMYLSPLEWPLLIRSFAGEHFDILIIALAITALLVWAALKLSSRRDVGAGLIPERTGRSAAQPGFKTVFALSWRIQRGSFISWLVFFAVIGYLLGSVAQILADFTSTAPSLAGFVERLGGPDRAFMSLMIYVIAMVISIYPILAIQNMRSEESCQRVETLLALPVTRMRFYLSHLFFSFAGIAVIMAVMGLTLGIGAVLATGDTGEFSRLLAETTAKIPAVWVIAGITALLFGLIPRVTAGISFTILSAFVLLEFFYEQGVVPYSVFSFSPFAQVYPTHPITVWPIIGLLTISALLAVLGGLAFRCRDITSN